MSAPDLFCLYLDAVAFMLTGVSPPLWARDDLHARVAVVLGFAHGKLVENCPEGLPLARRELLAEVARRCGEEQADADEVGEGLIRADERKRVRLGLSTALAFSDPASALREVRAVLDLIGGPL